MRADHELHRALHQRAVRAVAEEHVAAQQRRHHRLHLEVVLRDQRGDLVDELRLGVHVDEERQQLGREQLRRRRLLEDDVDDVVAAEVPGLAEERLGAVVVHAAVVVEAAGAVGVLAERPAGERARRLADVLLGVVADAQREQLHQLARVVLVGMRLDVDVVVEVAQHRRVLRHVQREVAHVAQRVLAEELVLHEQLLRRGLLLRRAGEVPVPEQRHLLLQRRGRRDHAAQPPLLHRDQVLAARAVVLHLERFARVDGRAVGGHPCMKPRYRPRGGTGGSWSAGRAGSERVSAKLMNESTASRADIAAMRSTSAGAPPKPARRSRCAARRRFQGPAYGCSADDASSEPAGRYEAGAFV